jgi:hypothetical protein
MRAILCSFALAAILNARNLTPAWVELGPDGDNVARVIVEVGDACPALIADGKALPMRRREPVPEGFQPACEAMLPGNAKSLKVGAQRLKNPASPASVVVFGDTGCRVAANELQACNDALAWPLRRNSQRIAATKPDLIVHVGDYLYREAACPDIRKGCAGPHGDNWAAWNADFFEPAAAALAATPWVFVRGNHENCARSWRGWFYYLAPGPFAAICPTLSDAWIAQSGSLRIGVLDSSQAPFTGVYTAAYVPRVTAQLAALSGKVGWVAVHHPFFAYGSDATGMIPTANGLGEAWGHARPAGLELIVAGHIHLFEFLAFGAGHPAQLVAGNGATALINEIKPKLAGETLFGAPVISGGSRHEFGYTQLRRSGRGWRLDLLDLNGAKAFSCTLAENGTAHCAN